MGNLIRRWFAAVKLAKGRCAECARILPDTGAPFPYRTCSEACASERWVTVNS